MWFVCERCGFGLILACYSDIFSYAITAIKNKVASRAVSKTKEIQPNRLVIQIQNCSKGNSQETLGTSGTQFGDPRVGVTKAQALEALELASSDLANAKNSIVKSPEFQKAENELQTKIMSSGPQWDVMKKNALQTTFEYKGTKYRIDVDSYVPNGNAPNLME